MERRTVTIDGNEAAAYVAFHTNEVCAIYPITPSSPMGEWADQWSSEDRRNIWGTRPTVVEMQSEGGASGAVHGALQTGALTSTFTASQGLLLMIPNMFKIAGELTSTVFHVSARTVASHALSIFGDHSDVMATRSTGFGLLASGSIQEVMDLALVAQAATLKGRVPVVHFFDGFRTSHEVQKIEELALDDMKGMIDDEFVRAHRARALSPDHPVLRGSAQNPDVFFQARERINPYYDAFPGIVQEAMDRFASIVGRSYHLFDYIGAPDAERVVVLMGSGAETAEEAVEYLAARGEKVGLIKVRLYRPFSRQHFIESLPKTVKAVTVLDRTKEAGSTGEPLYVDVVTALSEALGEDALPFAMPKVTGGRYGLSSKEFTPAMVKACLDEIAKPSPKNHFTVGIHDDVTGTSLEVDPEFTTEADDVIRCLFYGLGSDGTVGANKNSIKIIGEETPNYAQGYFVYDSKKAGSVTVSHLRFGPRPIKSTYLISKANFIGCHQFLFLEKFDMLEYAVAGGVFLLNSPYGPDEVWDKLPRSVQASLIEKKLKFYVIDGYKVARETGMGSRVNTIMQTCFFAISGVLPKDEAIAAIKRAIKKTYGAKGDEIVRKNYQAVDGTLANLHEVNVPATVTSTIDLPPAVSPEAPEYVQKVVASIIRGKGDELPVSALPEDGTFPTATAQWEKRNIAQEIPVWDENICIQCGKCAMVCPHAAIRIKVYDPKHLENAPSTFKSTKYKGREFENMVYTIQVAPEDCTGCAACAYVCPAKDKSNASHKSLDMADQIPLRIPERENYEFFLGLPEVDRTLVKRDTVKGSQFLQPLFEYSGACAGCGETPYVKLMSQLFGDRSIVANATGCSSIYGGNLPTTPWAVNHEGRGPTWSNSLFEDNAEFGLGFRLTLDKQNEYAGELLQKLSGKVGDNLTRAILDADQSEETGIFEQRRRIDQLREALKSMDGPDARNLESVADSLVKKSVWIVGGDGWAYDIGYGGLDHVLASGRNVNVLVLDTEVYSNTGGQCSKATPMGSVAKFAASGKPLPKKDLALMAMSYGNVYVARVAFGANDNQTVKAFIEADAYDGPSLIVAYSHCIAHGYDLMVGIDHQKAAVACGSWPLLRYNPDNLKDGKNPLKLDARTPKISYADYAMTETRFKMLTKSKPELAKKYMAEGHKDNLRRFHFYEQMAAMSYDSPAGAEGEDESAGPRDK
ncbi:MAG: pyruvate:ferredoxin (flavodoxin) oxidoreductase [Acidobacteriota bacterium]|jgi:pyruvate-ferredoxin/flavodoxin oxidoreductase